jgi:hypothetical protein
MHEAMIGGSPTLNNWLAIVGVVSLIYWAWRVFAMLQHRPGGTKQAPASVQAALPIAPGLGAPGLVAPLEDIPIIAAAVAAMMGAHRIVHLQAVGSGRNWAAEGRWMNQTSHNPG